MKLLTRKDELMLLAVLRLGAEAASLVALRELLVESTGTSWTVGNVFVSLDKLEGAGLITSSLGEPTARRGGKAVKYYSVTTSGLQALREIRAVQEGMWDGLHDMVLTR